MIQINYLLFRQHRVVDLIFLNVISDLYNAASSKAKMFLLLEISREAGSNENILFYKSNGNGKKGLNKKIVGRLTCFS